MKKYFDENGFLQKVVMPIMNNSQGYSVETSYEINETKDGFKVSSVMQTNFGGVARNYVCSGSQSECIAHIEKIIKNQK